MTEMCSNALSLGLEQQEIDKALMYCASFFGNMGNYKSFGDTKFIPDIPKDRFILFLLSSNCDKLLLEKYFQSCSKRLYSLTPKHRQVSINASFS